MSEVLVRVAKVYRPEAPDHNSSTEKHSHPGGGRPAGVPEATVDRACLPRLYDGLCASFSAASIASISQSRIVDFT